MTYGSGGFGSSGGRRSSGGFNRGGGGFRRSFGPREMHKIKCSECGKDSEVPFKPREGTPVYCRECFFKKKGIEPRSSSAPTESKPKAENAAETDAEMTEEGEAEDSEEF